MGVDEGGFWGWNSQISITTLPIRIRITAFFDTFVYFFPSSKKRHSVFQLFDVLWII